MAVREYQLFKGKWHNGLMTENNLANMFAKQPFYANRMLERVYQVSYGDTFLSYVNRFGNFETEERTYRWKMQGVSEKNVPLKGAWVDAGGSTAITTIPKPGANGTKFYLDFEEKYFGATEVILGTRPDLYRVWIISEPRIISPSLYRYECQLIGGDGAWIPASELAVGTRWSKGGGLVPNDFSDKGFGINYTSPFELKNRMTQFRMQLPVAGSMLREGVDNKSVWQWQFMSDDGTTHFGWMSHSMYEFLRQARVAKARTAYLSKSNELPNGSTFNISENGYPAEAGSGFEEMVLATNRHPYHEDNFSLEYLRDTILDTMEGKQDITNMEVTIGAGYRGLTMLKEMVQKQIGAAAYIPYMGDTSGRAYERSGQDIHVNFGNITGFSDIFGLKVKFMYLPHKDDPIHNKLRSSKGGLVSSYELDVMDMGKLESGKNNIQTVTLKGQAPVLGVINGMRSGFNSNVSGAYGSAKQLATPVDGSQIHYMDWTGFVVWNPTKIVQFKPSSLYA